MTEREPTPFGWYILRKMAEHDPPIRSQSALARISKINQSSISRWIYEPGKPEPDKLKLLADAIGVDHNELLVVAGHSHGDATVEQAVAALRPTIHHPLALEIDRMLADTSPIAEPDREAIATIIERVVDPYRRQMRRRRPA